MRIDGDPLHWQAQLRTLRKLKGMTQAELARRLSVSQSTVSRIEKGTAEPTLRDAVFISRALGFELTFVPRSVLPAVREACLRIEPNRRNPSRIDDMMASQYDHE